MTIKTKPAPMPATGKVSHGTRRKRRKEARRRAAAARERGFEAIVTDATTAGSRMAAELARKPTVAQCIAALGVARARLREAFRQRKLAAKQERDFGQECGRFSCLEWGGLRYFKYYDVSTDDIVRPHLDALKAAKLQLKSVKRAELRQMWEEWDRADPKVSA